MIKFILFFLISNIAIAITPHTAKYKLFGSGFELGTETRILSKNNDEYTYSANAQTEGLAKFIKDYKIDAKSNFFIDDRLYSKKFNSIEYADGKIKKQIDLVFTKKLIKGRHKSFQVENFGVDFLSLSLAIGYDLKMGNILNYHLANDKKVKVYKFNNKGNTKINLMNKEVNVIKLVADNIEVYIAKEYDYLPVLIKKKKWKYELKFYQVNNEV